MADHRGRLPETGAKSGCDGIFCAGVGCSGAAVAKLPDASSLRSERAASSWLCVQDNHAGIFGENLVECGPDAVVILIGGTGGERDTRTLHCPWLAK